MPIDQFPDYNFVGIIVGPRGLTQKLIQKETGAKIQINGNVAYATEPLHVLITADTEEKIKHAQLKIDELLIPEELKYGESKRSALVKLRELSALFNIKCEHCGELKPRAHNCPVIEKAYAEFMAEISAMPK